MCVLRHEPIQSARFLLAAFFQDSFFRLLRPVSFDTTDLEGEELAERRSLNCTPVHAVRHNCFRHAEGRAFHNLTTECLLFTFHARKTWISARQVWQRQRVTASRRVGAAVRFHLESKVPMPLYWCRTMLLRPTKFDLGPDVSRGRGFGTFYFAPATGPRLAFGFGILGLGTPQVSASAGIFFISPLPIELCANLWPDGTLSARTPTVRGSIPPIRLDRSA